MVTVTRSQMQRYGVAVSTVVSAAVVMLWLNYWITMTKSPFLLFYGAVMVSAWYGGMRPGLLATFLSALISSYLFISPIYSLALDLTESVRLSLFVLQGILISALCEALRTANRQLEVSRLKLRSSEERYRRIIDTAYEGIWTINTDGRIEYVNQRMAQMLGYSIADMLDRFVFEFMDEVVRSEAKRIFERCRQGVKEQFDFRYRCKDGSDLWTIVSTNPIFSETGEFQGAIAMITDVSERKWLEDKLWESEARFRRLVESNIIGVFFPDLEGHILDANDAFLQMVGYTREELRQGEVNWKAMSPLEYQALDEQKIEELKTSGICTPFEKEYIRKDGSRVPILVGAALLEGSKQQTIAFLLDLSERKQAEAKMQRFNEQLEKRVQERTAQLEEANKELESFSYSVSHDLRAPLRHISGFVDLLQKRAAPSLDETSLRYLNTIVQSAKQAGKLIDDLLAFSRMGRTELRYTTINMNQLIREVQRDIELDTEGRVIHWHVEELPQISGDPSMLRLVLRNLMENAVKYTSKRTQAEIEISCTENEDEFVFFIRDNGVGFDMQYVNKLFGVFQRLHSEQEFNGTGIGLANVRRIVHRHGGQTWAEAVVNNGATFYFSLPKVR